ncbi:MAG: hypothetical protein EOO65_05895, partial [Methanosarcinales archaeon]
MHNFAAAAASTWNVLVLRARRAADAARPHIPRRTHRSPVAAHLRAALSAAMCDLGSLRVPVHAYALGVSDVDMGLLTDSVGLNARRFRTLLRVLTQGLHMGLGGN